MPFTILLLIPLETQLNPSHGFSVQFNLSMCDLLHDQRKRLFYGHGHIGSYYININI